MLTRPLQRSGDQFVVVIPDEEVERRGLKEGQIVGVQLSPDEVFPRLSPELRRVMDRFWAEHGEEFDAMFGNEPGP